MQTITSTAELKAAIRVLEAEQTVKGRQLKEQAHAAYGSLKPAGILKGTVREMVSSPFLIENLLIGAVTLTSGYVAKKMGMGVLHSIGRLLSSRFLRKK